MEDADGVNAMLAEAKDAPKAVIALIHDRAKKLGLVADKKAKRYVAPTQIGEVA